MDLRAMLERNDSMATVLRGIDEVIVAAEAVYPDHPLEEETRITEEQQQQVEKVVVQAVSATTPRDKKGDKKASKGGKPATSGSLPPFLEPLVNYFSNPRSKQQVIMQDKLCFMLGLANCCLTAFLFGFPRAFMILFVCKSIVLLSARWAVYKLKNWHYYLLEFCYVCICIGILKTLFFPSSPFLHKLVFALFAGVLTPATVATRNSFVLHSIDKLTSLFQHLTPALVAWLLRWQTKHVVPGFSAMTPEQQQQFTRAGLVQLVVWPFCVWMVWAAAYYAYVFVLAEKKVTDKCYATMFGLQTKNPKAAFSKLVFSFKDKYLQYAVYMAAHGCLSLAGLLFTVIWFHSCVLHTAFVLTVLGVSMWNGATYYITIFPKYYMTNLESQASESKTTTAGKGE